MIQFSLQPNESIQEAARRIALEQTDYAIEQIARNENPHEGVHQARKCFKRIRALLRLVRDNLGKVQYQEENAFYRDMGRELAPLRDVGSQLEAFGRMETEDEELQAAVGYFVEGLQQKKEKMLAAFEEEQVIGQVKFRLSVAQKRIPEWEFHGKDRRAFRDSLARVYKRGQKAMEAARQEQTAKAYHEWRKRVKYLWHQVQVLEPTEPQELKKYAKTLKSLADTLGEDHDFALIEEELLQAQGELSETAQTKLKQQIAREQRKRRLEAFQLGDQFFREAPKTFTQRLEKYYHG